MSELHRLKRVVDSWMGKLRKTKKRRTSVYDRDDPRMIVTNLGLQMSPEALEWMTADSTRLEDFLVQIHMSEDELGTDLVRDNTQLEPYNSPKVYEEDGKVVFTVTVKGEEYIVAEFDREGE